jgi:uncharacterized protein
MTTSERELSLSKPQIDEIASGQPTAATLTLLRTGQASLRRLLLLAVRRRLGELAAGPFDLLGRAAAAAREPVEEIVTRPFAHDWGLRALTADPAEALRDLTRLATAAAIRAGLDLRTTLPATGGALFLPGLGVADRLHCDTVVLRQTGGALELGCPHPGAPAPRRRATRTISLADDWAITLEEHEPRRIVLGHPRAITPAALRDTEQLIRQAWVMAQAAFPGYARTARHLLRAISPLEGEDSTATSSSSPVAGGCIAMDVGVPAEIVVLMLIHETQHLLLAAAADLTPFCVPGGSDLFRAPWKHFPRTAPTLLQGVFAHAAVIDYWRVRRRAGPDQREALWQFAYLREVTTAAIGELRGSAELTGVGRRLVDGLLARAADWAAEAVPAAVAELASVTGRAESARWHLGNLRVAPGEAEWLARAYRREAPDRIVLPGRHMRPEGPDKPAPDGGLIARLHGAGLGREPAATAVPGLAAARRAVAESPAADEPWIALAAASPEPLLAARPDLVRAVLLALRARDGTAGPEADELAGWLSAREQ